MLFNFGEKMKKLWEAVRKIIFEKYEILKTRTIRESFYMVGDVLATLIGKITQEEFNWFATKDQGYASYRDDVWPALEQKYGLERPETRPYGTVYDFGVEYPISRLSEIWDQARGFIFTEKLEDGRDLKILSEYGWTIIAGGGFAGYPTRQVRQLLKADTRPILALHDGDESGKGIYRALGFETRRTKHLDIALGERVTDLGLSEEDIKKLSLPTRPEPPKYKGKPRAETSSLAVLTVRMGIENPKLAYAVAKMLLLGVKLSPLEKSKRDILRLRLRMDIRDALSKLISESVEEALKELKIEGEAASVETPEAEKIAAEEFKATLTELASKLGKEAKYLSEQDYHSDATKLTSPEMIRLLS